MTAQADTIVACGYTAPLSSVTLEKREDLTKVLLLHHLVLSRKSQLDQLAEGLQSLGFLGLLRENEDLFQDVLVDCGKPLTAQDIIDLLPGRYVITITVIFV